MRRVAPLWRYLVPLIAGSCLLIVPLIAGSLTATVVMPQTVATMANVEVVADDLKPDECNDIINILRVQTGSGTFSSDEPTVSSLLLGSPGVDDITGGTADDCIVGGAGADYLEGGDGYDVCVGNGTDTTFGTTCEDTWPV